MANGTADVEARNVAGAITSMGIDELISKLAIGIARGQMELDRVCMEIAQFMGDARIAFGKRPDSDEPDLMSLIELGFTPNFYQFVDTVLEVRVAVSSKLQETREYNTSDTQAHSSSYQEQSAYQSQQAGSSSGWGYSAGGSSWGASGWGWGASGWGYGASGSNYASSSSSSTSGSSAVKSTALALTTVDAKYASTYNYAVEASSLIKTKIVPVPPPEVFEEIVRAKVRERKEFEQRQRWRNQAIAAMTAIAGAADEILADAAMFPDSAINYPRDTATALRDALTGIEETLGGLTTDHWAVIGSVNDRSAMDTAIATYKERAATLVAQYPDGVNVPDNPELVETLLADIKSSIETLRARASAIVDRLAPPETPQTPPASLG